jgi:hypothetical protein
MLWRACEPQGACAPSPELCRADKRQRRKCRDRQGNDPRQDNVVGDVPAHSHGLAGRTDAEDRSGDGVRLGDGDGEIRRHHGLLQFLPNDRSARRDTIFLDETYHLLQHPTGTYYVIASRSLPRLLRTLLTPALPPIAMLTVVVFWAFHSLLRQCKFRQQGLAGHRPQSTEAERLWDQDRDFRKFQGNTRAVLQLLILTSRHRLLSRWGPFLF